MKGSASSRYELRAPTTQPSSSNMEIAQQPSAPHQVPRPRILMLSLKMRKGFEAKYSQFLSQLRAGTELTITKTQKAAMDYLRRESPAAIIAADQALTLPCHRLLVMILNRYLRAGAVVIFGLDFPLFTKMQDFDRMFEEGFQVPWKNGSYYRSRFLYNDQCRITVPFTTELMADASSDPFSTMKALQVKNTTKEEQIFVQQYKYPAIYDWKEATTWEPKMTFGTADPDPSQAPIVGRQVGDGFLIYVGDGQLEVAAQKVILSFCKCPPSQ